VLCCLVRLLGEQELLEEKRRREEAARRGRERLERELEEQELEEARQLPGADSPQRRAGRLVGLEGEGQPGRCPQAPFTDLDSWN